MSKVTLAVAAASATAGAAVTALFFNSRKPAAPTPAASAAAATVLATAPATTTVPAAKAAKDIVAPVNPSGFFQYGFPGPVNDVAARSGLVSCYDRRLRNPMWVAEHITAESLALKGGDRKNSAFLEDMSIPEKFRGKLKDYFRSGYDRGHQVPAADCKWSQQAMDDTFYLSNMCPQVGDGFNRDYWSHFEDFCRRLTQKYASVRIVTGPLYLPRKYPDGKWRVSYEVIGEPANIAVPTHFFKVIVAESNKASGDVAVGAFVLPNAEINNNTKLTEFEVPVEAVERASGLEFMSLLPENKKRQLCKEVNCTIVVRDFSEKAKKALPAPK